MKLEMTVPVEVLDPDGTVVRTDSLTFTLVDDEEGVPSPHGTSAEEDRPQHL